MFDLIIAGGLLVDGTGAPPRPADVGIIGGTIDAVENLGSATAERTIDATGLVVSPGFIDVHVHSELARHGGLDQYSGVAQGVTCELMSPDGFSWAPVGAARAPSVHEYLEPFYGKPDSAFETGSVEGYFSWFAGRLPAHLVPQAPHLPLRVEAMGWDARPARPHELTRMRELLDDWLNAGAVAFATGLEYQPAAGADLQELVELSRVAAGRDRLYVAHQRGYFAEVQRGFEETFEIARKAKVGVHISHLALTDLAGELLEKALAEDLDVSFDMYPYAASCTHLLMMLPEWAQAGGLSASLDRLAAPEERERLRSAVADRLEGRGEIILSSVPGNPALEGHSLAELAEENGQGQADFLLDLLVAQRGNALAIYRWAAALDPDLILTRTLRHRCYVGSSDGILVGGTPHPRGFGTFARIVGNHVRSGTLTLEEAVHKVTGAPASRFGIQKRGRIQRNLAADIVVFDQNTLTDRASMAHGRTAPDGICHVIVDGNLVWSGGSPTGILPGKILFD